MKTRYDDEAVYVCVEAVASPSAPEKRAASVVENSDACPEEMPHAVMEGGELIACHVSLANAENYAANKKRRADNGGDLIREGTTVLARHAAVRRWPDHFERLPDSDARAKDLRRELEFRAAQMDELDELEAAGKARERQRERAIRWRSEDAFWRDVGAELERFEFGFVDQLPDPAREEDEEASREKQRLARLDPDRASFWDESIALGERIQAEQAFPVELRKETDDLDDKAVLSRLRKLLDGDG